MFGFEDNFHLAVIARDLDTPWSAIVTVVTDGKLPRVIGTVVLVLWLKIIVKFRHKSHFWFYSLTYLSSSEGYGSENCAQLHFFLRIKPPTVCSESLPSYSRLTMFVLPF